MEIFIRLVMISNFDVGHFYQTLANDGHDINDKKVQEDFSRKVYGKEEQSLAKDGKNIDYIYYVSLVF